MEYHSGGSLPLLGRPRYCPGANSGGGYLCESGHCCAESGCCTYYYELWWFWLLWTVLILFSCCCAYRHRRAKLRVQQQQRQRDISLLAYQGAASFPSSMIDLSFLASLKLPSYEEVAAQPSTPPPPYSSVFTAPRYPQPPRSAHPHLLSGHPLGASQHPGPRCPLSDGPSSLSSDNSSSCSCDSCCPSSPCSSSLSAPVTYETDTSHASTPSEAPPLALDPVAIETISAAAARLGSKDPASAVAILIERTDPATESVVAAGSALPSDPDASIPVGRALPSKNTDHSGPDARTLENTSFQTPRTLPLILDSVGGNTDTNPSLVPISVSPPNLPRAETQSSKTDTNVPTTSPNTSPSQTSPASRTVHTNPSPSQSPKLADCSPQSQGIAHFSLKPAGEPSERAAEVTEQGEGTSRESPSLTEPEDTKNPLDVFGRGEQTVELCKSTQVLATSTNRAETTSSQPEVSLETSSELYQNSKSKTTVSSPVFTGLKLTPEPTVFSPEAKFETPTVQELATTQSTESASVTMPEFECPSISSSQNTPDGFQEAVPPISQLCLERPSETTPAKAVASDTDVVSPTLDQEKGLLERSTQEENSASLVPPTVDLEREKLPGIKAVDSEVLDLERPDDTSQSSLENEREELCVLKPADSGRPNSELPGPDSLSKGDSLQTSDQEINLETAQKQSELLDLESSLNSSFPAITIEADPPSFAGSPCSIPSLPQSPTNATLHLDPLSALQPSDRSAASSGHASSLSPSPRNTQSPPKQTLFSPCVDVFEPVDPSWEDEESEEQNDEEYCEDSDVAADESQYRHRRLTGDSGIEVCRCRMEDEDEEEEEEEREKVKVSVSGEKMAELHDSVDCPGRSRRSSLCNTEASAETVAISVETV